MGRNRVHCALVWMGALATTGCGTLAGFGLGSMIDAADPQDGSFAGATLHQAPMHRRVVVTTHDRRARDAVIRERRVVPAAVYARRWEEAAKLDPSGAPPLGSRVFLAPRLRSGPLRLLGVDAGGFVVARPGSAPRVVLPREVTRIESPSGEVWSGGGLLALDRAMPARTLVEIEEEDRRSTIPLREIERIDYSRQRGARWVLAVAGLAADILIIANSRPLVDYRMAGPSLSQ